MKIGIFGGTFNPLHNGHIALAKAFLNQAHLDEVWFVVSPQNPFKRNDALLDDNIRLKMVGEALKDEPKLIVSDIEFHLPKPSYMYLTLRRLKVLYPQNAFTLLIGGDNWKAFGRWKNSDEIVENYQIAVYPRRNDDINAEALSSNVKLLKTPLLDISSTQIRQLVHDGKSVSALVPPSIASFISRHHLYQE